MNRNSASVLLLTAFSITTPRWQQIKYLCDKLPDTPRSRWERYSICPGGKRAGAK